MCKLIYNKLSNLALR